MPGEHGNASASAPAAPLRLLLTALEAAEALAVSPRTLWGLTDRGEIPCVRLGRSVRYDVEDLRAYVASKKSGGPAGANGDGEQN
jgi:excisionase family DNA binding protein